MRIGIDITMLVYAGSGVANYTYNLVKALLEIDKKNEYRLFYSSLRRPKNFYYLDELKKAGGKVYNFRFPPSFLKLWWSRLHVIPVEWFIGKVDVFFSSDFLRPPLFLGTKGITTVHDLVWKIYPQFHEDWIVTAHEKKLEKTIKYNDTIIVDSQNTMQDLLKLYPQINKNKVHVIYPGIDERFCPIKDKEKIKKVLQKYGVFFPTPFLLYVGAIEPRKNLDLAIEIFHQLVTNHQQQFTNYKFIIAGRAGWKNEKIFQMVKDLKLEDKVKFVGFIEDGDLPYLYNAASLTVYLSTYEGFGLPPLESLACGTKVITGDNSSMKETVDEKFLVDVNDKNKILEKMKYLLKNKIEINSKAVKEKFAWKNSAQQFLKIISCCISSNPHPSSF
ncbi:glycosyltransferase family 4 protein [Candidatus Roizmanbacteria bacterium]|nr:glycosyltransferase family 4 protein [Candidatus Roizmanbacteria bacterium]